jgi:hypothetical protein
MSRTRITARVDEAGILAEIGKLETMVEAGMDEQLVQEAQGLANEEVKIVEDAAAEPVSENVEQNERAQDNWPMKASEREELATSLVVMAKRLMND